MVRHWQKKDHQKGTALVMVLSLTVVILMFGILSSRLITESTQNTQEEFRKQAQASNIARAGLRDAIGWFKNKASSGSGKVSHPGSPSYAAGECADDAFAPTYNSDPSLRQTDDASIGLVKDIRLDVGRNIYGRYIVRQQPCKITGGDYLPDEANYEKSSVHDISGAKGKGVKGDGVAWRIVSEGIVYQRNNRSKNADGVFTTDPDEAPNRILERSFVEMDINRMTLNKPDAPIIVTEPHNGGTSQSSFNNNCKVVGRNAVGTLYYDPSGGQNPSGNPDCQFEDCTGGKDGKKSRFDGVTHPMSIEEVFAVSKDEIQSMSDYVYTSRDELEASFYKDSLGRSKLPMAIYYIDGNITFNNAHVLQGSGIFFVDGNLTLDPDSFTFTGLVYVTGQITMKDNNEISGAAFGNKIVCTPGLKATFEYNEGILETVRDTLALYRENTLTFQTK